MHLCEEHGVQRLYQVQDSTTARVQSRESTSAGESHCQVQEEWYSSGSGKWAKVVKQVVEQKMSDDDETTAVQLHRYLSDQGD